MPTEKSLEESVQTSIQSLKSKERSCRNESAVLVQKSREVDSQAAAFQYSWELLQDILDRTKKQTETSQSLEGTAL